MTMIVLKSARKFQSKNNNVKVTRNEKQNLIQRKAGVKLVLR